MNQTYQTLFTRDQTEQTQGQTGPNWTNFDYPGPNWLKHVELHWENHNLCVSNSRPKTLHYFDCFLTKKTSNRRPNENSVIEIHCMFNYLSLCFLMVKIGCWIQKWSGLKCFAEDWLQSKTDKKEEKKAKRAQNSSWRSLYLFKNGDKLTTERN